MKCEECSKCWLNYIEKCDGQEVFKEDKCKKNLVNKNAVQEANK